MKKISVIAIATIVLAFLLSMTPVPSIGKDMAIAAAKVASVNVLNWPAVQNTAEQNVDANGHIEVHEQGEVTVNGAVDVSNLPLDGDGNVKVAETADTSYAVVTLLDNVPCDSSLASSPVSIDGYRFVSFLGKTTSGMQRFAARFQTETGEARQIGQAFQLNHNGVSGFEPIKIPVLGPQLLVGVVSCESTSPITIKAYLTR